MNALPPADPADVYFDMEGYPLALGGLEYLFGACFHEGGHLLYRDWWAHSRTEEKVAFEAFVDWVFARWRENPQMHIYHYAAYEASAIRRLSTGHATREEEVDRLLRNHVFVDLYQIVRQGILLGEDSYSIKKMELLYRHRRRGDVATAGDSIVEYANWIASNESVEPLRSVATLTWHKSSSQHHGRDSARFSQSLSKYGKVNSTKAGETSSRLLCRLQETTLQRSHS